MGTLEVARGQDRIGPFQAQDVADRGTGRRIVRPERDMAIEARSIDDRNHLPRLLHRAVPGELPLGLRPGDLGAVPAGQRVVGRGVAGDQRRDAEPDPAAPHLDQRDHPVAPILLVGLPRFALADLGHRQGNIAIPIQGVHAEVEMGIEDQHRCSASAGKGVSVGPEHPTTREDRLIAFSRRTRGPLPDRVVVCTFYRTDGKRARPGGGGEILP